MTAKRNNSVRYLLFDAVGTLIRVRPSVAEVYAGVGARYGSQLTIDAIQRTFEESLERHLDSGPTDEARERRRWRAIVGEVLCDIPHAGDAPFEELWGSFGGPEQWSLFPDVPPVWDELVRRGFGLGIASNFDSRLIPLCRAMPPLHRTELLFVSSQIGFSKPHPDFFRAVQCQLGVPPHEILLVGDSVQNDVLGARQAGWQAVHLDRERGDPSRGSIASLTELLELL